MVNWSEKRVLLLGFGEEGRANLRYLQAYSPRSISIADQSTELSLTADEQRVIQRYHLGPDWLEALGDYDVIVRSPGVPRVLLDEALENGANVHITSGTDIFLARHAAKTIGVTATKGKSTTSSLLHATLVASGMNAHLGGNIGIPALLLQDTAADLFVLELSSYQLEDITHSPHGALFLNLYPEHLDHHRDFRNYANAKARITRFQSEDDFLVLPTHHQAVIDSTTATRAHRIFFGDPSSAAWIENDHYHVRMHSGRVHQLCNIHETRLKGPGNHQNILAVLATLSRYPITPSAVSHAISSFAPLPHRLEEVATIDGVTYINDSISTVPEATINALDTFGDAVKTIIIGGYDRGITFEGLAHYLRGTAVRTIILFPPSGARIEAALRDKEHERSAQVSLFFVDSMQTAVRLAHEHTPPGSMCVLSPASPSFPLFKNFKERGDSFKREVLRLNAG